MKCIVKKILEEVNNNNLPSFVPVYLNIEVQGNGTLPVVEISTNLDNASIYYTIDGSEPTAESGTLYSGLFFVEQSCTLKAIAISSTSQTSIVSRQLVYAATKTNLCNEVTLSNSSPNTSILYDVVVGDVIVMSLSDFSITGTGYLATTLERGDYKSALKDTRRTHEAAVLSDRKMFAFVVTDGTDEDVTENESITSIGATRLIRVKSFTGATQQGQSISAYSEKVTVDLYRPE